jgi:F-type H+-transporting ATPase subunit epsilon
MAKTLQLEVLARDRHVFSGVVASVTLPAVDGLMGILPGHAPLVTALGPGAVAASPQALCFPVSGGFAQVLPDRVTVIADSSQP